MKFREMIDIMKLVMGRWFYVAVVVDATVIAALIYLLVR